MMPFPVDHPLGPGLEGLDRLKWPDPAERQRFADLAYVHPTAERLLVGEHPFALYERAWLLGGLQNLLAAMTENPPRVGELFGRIGLFEETIARQYIQVGVEAAWITDDYGMNSALVFSPELWRRFIKPHLQRIVDRYHAAGALVILHSGGNVTALIDDFLEVGFDVLDPLQPNCNDLELIRRRTDGQMCLSGGIESSTLFSEDTTRTTLQTHRRIGQLGRKGGYIVGPDDEWDYPASTSLAMLEAVEHYRDDVRRQRR